MPNNDKTVGPKSISETILFSTVPAFNFPGYLTINGTCKPLFPTARFCLKRLPP